MTAPRLSKLGLWDQVCSELLQIVESAVARLPPFPPDTGEVAINIRLAKEVASIIYERSSVDPDAIAFGASSDGLNLAMDTDTEVADRKKPDLQWLLIDASRPLAGATRSFVVECKRLGSRSKAGYDFNSAYVRNGVARFLSVDWRYGRNADIGVMVGYLQSGGVKAVHEEVNAVAVKEGLQPIGNLSGSASGVHHGSHTLSRAFEMSPFSLRHMWKQVI